MTVRSTMASLITRTRTLINDPVGANQLFADQDVQDSLDRYRLVARFVPLRPEPFFQPGGILHFYDYYGDFGDWEDGETLFDNAFNVIDLAPPNGHGTLVSRDLLTGHWSFTDNAAATPIGMPFGQIPMVRINGNTYDVYMAAAMLLEEKLAHANEEFTFTTNQQSFYRNQQFDMILKTAEIYRRQARPEMATIFRGDQTLVSGLAVGGWVGSGYYAT